MAILNDVTEVLHKIEAKLYPNYLGKGDGAYIARSKAEAPLSIEDICASAKNRGGFTGSYEDMVEHVRLFINETVYQLLDGFSAQLGHYFSLHTRIGGTYSGKHDLIDSDNISVTFRTLAKLKEALKKIKVENEGVADHDAYIDEIVDAYTGSLNGTISPGGMINISGNKIKVEGEGDCGLWIVPESGTRSKLDGHFAVNRPTEVVALLPASIPPGKYKLEIVTRYSHGSTLLKEPRTITADCFLTVA